MNTSQPWSVRAACAPLAGALGVCLLAAPAAAQVPSAPFQASTSIVLSGGVRMDDFDSNTVGTAVRAVSSGEYGTSDTRSGRSAIAAVFGDARARVSAGLIGASAYGGASAAADPLFGQYGVSGSSQARAAMQLPFRVPATPLLPAGTPGYFDARLNLSGVLSVDPGFSAPGALFPGTTSGSGFVGVDVSGTPTGPDAGCGAYDWCHSISYSGSNGSTYGSPLDAVLAVRFPFVVGSWTSLNMQMFTQATYGVSLISNQPTQGAVLAYTASALYGNTLAWGGIDGLYVGGQRVDRADWTVDSLPGLNLAAPVPEPAGWALGLGGLALLAWHGRRRMPGRG